MGYEHIASNPLLSTKFPFFNFQIFFQAFIHRRMVAERTVQFHNIDRKCYENSNALEREIKKQLYYLSPIFVKAIKTEAKKDRGNVEEFWQVFLAFARVEDAKRVVKFNDIQLEYGQVNSRDKTNPIKISFAQKDDGRLMKHDITNFKPKAAQFARYTNLNSFLQCEECKRMYK